MLKISFPISCNQQSQAWSLYGIKQSSQPYKNPDIEKIRKLVLQFEISIFECSFVNYVQLDIRIGILQFKCITRFEYPTRFEYVTRFEYPTRFEYSNQIRISHMNSNMSRDSNIPTRFECQFGNAFAKLKSRLFRKIFSRENQLVFVILSVKNFNKTLFIGLI